MNRIRLVSIGKAVALLLFVAVGVALVVYLVARKRPPLPPAERPKLQGRVVAIFNNTRYAHEVDGRVRFILNAGVDRTYEDGTHELEQVRLESFGADGTRSDVLTAERAEVSDPSDLTQLNADFKGNVVIQTADGMTVKTETLHYDYAKSIARSPDLVEFDGPKFAGRSLGVIVEAADERLRLLKDVDLTIKPEGKPEGAAQGDKAAPAKECKPRRQLSPEERAARKARKRARREARLAAGGQNAGGKKANAKKSSAPAILPASAKLPTRIRGAEALVEMKERRIEVNGNAIVMQGDDEMRSDRMIGLLNEDNRIERIEARGNAYLKQAGRAEIKASNMDFFFEEGGGLTRALATGNAYARTLGDEPVREARAARMEAIFSDAENGSTLDTVIGEGEAWIRVNAPSPKNERDNPAVRELAAGTVTMEFREDGRSLESAEAREQAVLTVTPVRAEAGAEKKTIRAPLMTAEFFEDGNRIQTFNASGGVQVEIVPMVAGERPPRTTSSRTLAATFMPDTQDVATLEQAGDFKYVEGVRNAVAERAAYDNQREFLALRGGRPMIWDDKARTQGDEIDYDRKADKSYARGDVRTTYYSRASTNDATPFKNSKSPIYMTAQRAEADHAAETAVYTGNARGWQDDNFVKADRIELYNRDKRMVAEGWVESALYRVEQKGEGQSETVPGFATADRMVYSDTERTVRYTGNVKARQGTDRLEGHDVLVYLKAESSDVDKIFAEGEVVMTQPGRRGMGDKLVYTADDGKAVLSGRNARVEDAEKGTSTGAQLTFYSRDDRASVESQGSGRVRSTHRVTRGQK